MSFSLYVPPTGTTTTTTTTTSVFVPVSSVKVNLLNVAIVGKYQQYDMEVIIQNTTTVVWTNLILKELLLGEGFNIANGGLIKCNELAVINSKTSSNYRSLFYLLQPGQALAPGSTATVRYTLYNTALIPIFEANSQVMFSCDQLNSVVIQRSLYMENPINAVAKARTNAPIPKNNNYHPVNESDGDSDSDSDPDDDYRHPCLPKKKDGLYKKSCAVFKKQDLGIEGVSKTVFIRDSLNVVHQVTVTLTNWVRQQYTPGQSDNEKDEWNQFTYTITGGYAVSAVVHDNKCFVQFIDNNTICPEIRTGIYRAILTNRLGRDEGKQTMKNISFCLNYSVPPVFANTFQAQVDASDKKLYPDDVLVLNPELSVVGYPTPTITLELIKNGVRTGIFFQNNNNINYSLSLSLLPSAPLITDVYTIEAVAKNIACDTATITASVVFLNKPLVTSNLIVVADHYCYDELVSNVKSSLNNNLLYINFNAKAEVYDGLTLLGSSTPLLIDQNYLNDNSHVITFPDISLSLLSGSIDKPISVKITYTSVDDLTIYSANSKPSLIRFPPAITSVTLSEQEYKDSDFYCIDDEKIDVTTLLTQYVLGTSVTVKLLNFNDELYSTGSVPVVVDDVITSYKATLDLNSISSSLNVPLHYSDNTHNYKISVQASNACGDSLISYLSVVLNNKPIVNPAVIEIDTNFISVVPDVDMRDPDTIVVELLKNGVMILSDNTPDLNNKFELSPINNLSGGPNNIYKVKVTATNACGVVSWLSDSLKICTDPNLTSVSVVVGGLNDSPVDLSANYLRFSYVLSNANVLDFNDISLDITITGGVTGSQNYIHNCLEDFVSFDIFVPGLVTGVYSVNVKASSVLCDEPTEQNINFIVKTKLEVSKSYDDTDTIYQTGPIKYTIDVKNSGPYNVAGESIFTTDVLTNLNDYPIVSGDPGSLYDIDTKTLVNNIYDLDVNETKSIEIEGVIPISNNLTLTNTATSVHTYADTGSVLSSSVSFDVLRPIDLSINMEEDQVVVATGDVLTYKLTVSNSADFNVANVDVVDIFPNGYVVGTVTVDDNLGTVVVNPTFETNKTKVTVSIASFLANSSVVIHIPVTFPAPTEAGETFVNTANVITPGNVYDTNSANNVVNLGVAVNKKSDIGVSFSVIDVDPIKNFSNLVLNTSTPSYNMTFGAEISSVNDHYSFPSPTNDGLTIKLRDVPFDAVSGFLYDNGVSTYRSNSNNALIFGEIDENVSLTIYSIVLKFKDVIPLVEYTISSNETAYSETTDNTDTLTFNISVTSNFQIQLSDPSSNATRFRLDSLIINNISYYNATTQIKINNYGPDAITSVPVTIATGVFQILDLNLSSQEGIATFSSTSPAFQARTISASLDSEASLTIDAVLKIRIDPSQLNVEVNNLFQIGTLPEGWSDNNTSNDSSTNTFTIKVPSFNMASTLDDVNNTAGQQTITSFCNDIMANSGTTSNLVFNVTNDNNNLFLVQPAINAITGTLTFTPNPNSFGSTTISVILTDGVLTSSISTVDIAILFVQNDSRVVVGGNYYSLTNSLPGNVSTVDKDSISTALGSLYASVGNIVIQAIAYDSSTQILYIGGTFNLLNSVQISNIAKYDVQANQWSALDGNVGNVGLNSEVRTLILDSTNKILYVGGAFTSTIDGTPLTVNRIAKYNVDPLATTGNRWSVLDGNVGNTGLASTVFALALDSTNKILYVGGAFTSTIDGTPLTVNRIAKYNVDPLATTGNRWSVLNGNTSGTTINNTGLGGEVRALVLDSTNKILYIGGIFSNTLGGTIISPINHIAKYDVDPLTATGNRWSRLDGNTSGTTVGNTGLNGSGVFTLTLDSTNKLLYVGGLFTSTVGGTTLSVNNIAKYNVDSLATTGNRWSRLDGNTSGTTINNTGLNNQVNALALDSANKMLYVGGLFISTVGGTTLPVNNIAKYNVDPLATTGNRWSVLTTNGLNNQVLALTLDSANNMLYVGGLFTSNSGNPIVLSSRLIKYNTSSNTWISQINSMYIIGTTRAYAYDSDNKILYVGGTFTFYFKNSLEQQVLNNIAKYDFNTNQWSALDGNVGNTGLSGQVNALSLDSANKILYVGGNFISTTSGTTLAVNNIAKYNVDPLATTGNRWSRLDGNVGNTGLTSTVFALALDSTNKILYVGGFFNSTVSGTTLTVNNIAKYNVDPLATTGNRWSVLDGNVGNTGLTGSGNPSVFALALDSTYKILYIGGGFASTTGAPLTTNNIAVNFIARYNIDPSETGNRWSRLDGNTSGTTINNTGLSSFVTTLLIDSTNKILYVGGSFSSTTGGVPLTVNNIAKYNVDPSLAVGNRWSRFDGNSSNTTVNNTGLSNSINALALDSDNKLLYVGGTFTTTSGGTTLLVNRIAKYNVDPSLSVTGNRWLQVINNGINGVIGTSLLPNVNALLKL